MKKITLLFLIFLGIVLFQQLVGTVYASEEITPVTNTIVSDEQNNTVSNSVYEDNSVIVFEDKNLEIAIRRKISKPEGDIIRIDVCSIESLDLSNAQISNITALSNFTMLTELNLSENQISDITPLSNLPHLTKLFLYNNQISDISPLSNLSNLISLDLENNPLYRSSTPNAIHRTDLDFTVAGTKYEVWVIEVALGDVDGDRKLTSIDFGYMRKYLLAMISEFPAGDKGLIAADVDGNGKYNSIDFAYMRQYLLGMIDRFPADYQTVTPSPTSTILTTPTPTATATPTPTSSPTGAFTKVIPSNVNVIISGLNSISLTWDNVDGAVMYEVFRDGILIGTTSNLSYTDSSLVEGLDYAYFIKAVNSKGESSLDSDKVIVNILDVIINSDTVLNENRFYKSLKIDSGVSLDLNGHKLDVQTDFIQTDGVVNINSGILKIGRDYSIGSNGILQMKNDKDYVYIGRNFETTSKLYYGYYDERNDYLIAGTMEVKGNFTSSYQAGCFLAKGNHKVVLSGDAEQVVYNDSGWLIFNELEIRNPIGVRFDSTTPIMKMKGHYKVIGEFVITRIESVIGDITIDGDLTIRDLAFDLAGHNLTVTGNLTQISENEICILKINTGKLCVYGNYTIGTEEIVNLPEPTYSTLQMINEEDYVYVGGNFIAYSGNTNREEANKYLTAGVMEVKGNFGCRGYPWEWEYTQGCYVAIGSHKVILSGNSEQVVYNDSGWQVFNELEIRNPIGVRFDSTTPIMKMKGHYKVLGELIILNIESITGDVTIDGDATLLDTELDLKGYDFTVTGNFAQRSYDTLSIVKVNGGKLRVNGDYRIGYGFNDEAYESTAGSILEMLNGSDYVYVGGDFTTNSSNDHRNHLTAGTLEIRGNFTQKSYSGSSFNFAATGTHKVILSGDSIQTITFEDPMISCFNILEVTKPLETGYIFNTTPVWNTLIE